MGQQSSKKTRKVAKEKDKDASSDAFSNPSPDESPDATVQPALSRPDDVSTSTTNGSESSLNGNSASSPFSV
jgi:hypothetical protein